MAENRLRDLERRFKESGSPDDELAYLQEQVRTGVVLDWESYSRLAELNVEAAADYLRARVERGDLAQEKLELAAYCSHDPARLVLGEAAPEVPEDLEEWAEGFGAWGKRALVQAGLHAARLAQPFWEESYPGDANAAEAIAAAANWLACPCPQHAAAAEEAASDAEGVRALWDESPPQEALEAVTAAAEVAFAAGEVSPLLSELENTSLRIGSCFACAAECVPVEALREAAECFL